MSYAAIQERLTAVLGLDPSALSRVGFEAAVRARMRETGFAELGRYAERVAVDMGEFERLAMAVMVHETSFFRYPASFDLLVGEVRARLLEDPRARVHLHCVATSTGEEPASVVMSLLDGGVDLDRVRVEASDVSERAVDYARAGRYRARSVERLPAGVRARWFAPDGDGFRLARQVHERIDYRRVNALDPLFGLGEAPYDALFCRNLLIYLVPAARVRLLERLRGMLRPGGLLFVGHAEVSAAREAGLELASPPEAFACRLVVRRPAPVPRTALRQPPGAARPPRPPLRRPLPPPAAPPEAPDPHEVLRRAARLADAGDLAQARRALLDGIAGGPATADHYHLLALVESACGRERESEDALRRALYLDPHHYPSLMQLALLAETLGDRGRAQRLRAKAARVKEGGDGR